MHVIGTFDMYVLGVPDMHVADVRVLAVPEMHVAGSPHVHPVIGTRCSYRPTDRFRTGYWYLVYIYSNSRPRHPVLGQHPIFTTQSFLKPAVA